MPPSKRVTWTREEESVILRAGVEGLPPKSISAQFVFKGKEPVQVKTKAGNLRNKIEEYREAVSSGEGTVQEICSDGKKSLFIIG